MHLFFLLIHRFVLDFLFGSGTWPALVLVFSVCYKCWKMGAGFMWKGFGSGVASVRCQKLPPSNRASSRHLQDGSATSSTNDSGSTLRTMYLRMEKNLLGKSGVERGVRIWDTTLQTLRSVQKRKRSSWCWSGGPLGGHTNTRCAPVAHGGPQGAEIHLQSLEEPDQSRGMCSKEALTLWRPCAGAGSWQHLRTCGGPPMEYFIPKGLHSVERTHGGEVHGELYPTGEPCCWSRGRAGARGRSSRDKGWWTDHNPHSTSCCTTAGEEVDNVGVKLSPGRRAECRKVFLRFEFIS